MDLPSQRNCISHNVSSTAPSERILAIPNGNDAIYFPRDPFPRIKEGVFVCFF